jgi:predicted HAD superfamily phosphohydrolase YqeG
MWSNDLSEVSENMKFLTLLEEIDLRVILFSQKEKERIKRLVPRAKVHFSNSCNCGY